MMNQKNAIHMINKYGFLLVFPMGNASFPKSLWQVFFPNTPMRWEWDDNGDGNVLALWRLREQLASSRQVVYGKYYRGRATFFSKRVFCDLLAIRQAAGFQPKSDAANEILELLEFDSPLSTKQLREMTGLKGKLLEPVYKRAMQELWQSFSIVATGEIDDGAFPSLAHGATKTIFEELWLESLTIDSADAWMRLCDLAEFEILEQSLIKTSISSFPEQANLHYKL
jgi:hypothetical protein